MSPNDSFLAVMLRLRDSDGDGAREVFCRFSRRLIALARSRLDARVCRKTDPEDVIQSVYRSFFARHEAGDFAIPNWDSLW